MRKIAGICVGIALLALPAAADHWRGIRVSVQNVDQPTREVDISVTGYTSEDTGLPPFDETDVEEGTPDYGEPYTAELTGGQGGEPPGLSWGDGEYIEETVLPAIAGGPFRRYRGSFSHTYEDTGTYTIRAASCCAPGTEQAEFEEILTGNFIPPGPESPYTSGALTNTAQITLGAIAFPSEVPLSRTALFVLAALLGGAAVWVVRRSS